MRHSVAIRQIEPESRDSGPVLTTIRKTAQDAGFLAPLGYILALGAPEGGGGVAGGGAGGGGGGRGGGGGGGGGGGAPFPSNTVP